MPRKLNKNRPINSEEHYRILKEFNVLKEDKESIDSQESTQITQNTPDIDITNNIAQSIVDDCKKQASNKDDKTLVLAKDKQGNKKDPILNLKPVQKGEIRNPSGRPKGTDYLSQLQQALKTVERQQGKSFLTHFIERAYVNDKVAVALCKKLIPDMTQIEIKQMTLIDFAAKIGIGIDTTPQSQLAQGIYNSMRGNKSLPNNYNNVDDNNIVDCNGVVNNDGCRE